MVHGCRPLSKVALVILAVFDGPPSPVVSWWQVINRSTTELPLTVSYDKISLGRLRFWIHMQDAVYSLQQFGGWPWALAEVGGDAW